jgi:hypothetical protein
MGSFEQEQGRAKVPCSMSWEDKKFIRERAGQSKGSVE